jgi:(S)-2-hydroxyglutarate dehydrogenase
MQHPSRAGKPTGRRLRSGPVAGGDESFDVVVIGAGIVGLATARALLLKRPQLRLAVLEKESAAGTHQTGHNSGVIHSGIYYKPGSLKARLCIEGKRKLELYATERGIPFEACGKLIVALDAQELPRLDELHRRAVANGVEGLRELGPDELRDVEPHATGLRALHAPHTGIIDYGGVTLAYADDVRAMGGQILTGRGVTGFASSAREVRIETDAGPLDARAVIGCAGLQSDRLARLAGARPSVRIVPFRGDYYTLGSASRELVRGLLYPVPDPAFPFLGVHFTKRIDGSVVAGPNAVLALARERYRRAALDMRDAASALAYKGSWKFVARHLRTGMAELHRDVSKRAFVRDMQRYVPDVGADDVTFGPTGIRAQALAPDGNLVDDFLIVGTERMMHVLNAPSPAATASLAIGDELAERALRDVITSSSS